MKIRVADVTQLKAIYGLLQSQFDEHEISLDSESLKKAILELLREDRWGFILAAQEGGVVAGVAVIAYAWTLEHGGKSAWLDELYVIPEWRNRGIGAALLERVFAEARQRGCLAIDLEVEDEHRRAENLYRRYGFEHLERNRWARPL